MVFLLLLILAGAGYWYYSQRPMFPELQGPVAVTRLPQPGDFTLDMSTFPAHGKSAIALFVNDPNSSWYGIASGLGSMGIPFRIVTDVETALAHDVVMVYPSLSGANTSAEALQGLAAHVRNGGTLLAFSVLGGGMNEVFGFAEATEHPAFRTMEFTESDFSSDFARSDIEGKLDLGAGEFNSGSPGISYSKPKHPAVAVYDDGSVAITHNFFESEAGIGHAYALGLDLGHFILHAHNGRYFSTDDNYVNTYHPQIDTMLRFIAKVYRQGEPDAVLLSPTPQGKDVTILMTHDIDFTRSIVNAPIYAEVERAAGVPATYFIQTKYIKDYSDDYFLDPERSAYLRELVDMGMEIGSHSVAHSRVFENLEAGTGAEQYPQYKPFVEDFREVRGATIAGELRISKFLLEALTGENVVSFRPGHLSHPRSLPQMLSATGFMYSSAMTANEALTHLPFRPMYERSYETPVNVYEFPVTIEDEKGRLGDRVDEAIDVTRNIARYHGLVTVLVHTDSTDHKLDFTREYIAAFRETAWFGKVSEFGQWWAARETVAIEVMASSVDQRQVEVSVAGSIDGLTLDLPPGWIYRSGPEGSRQQGSLLTLGAFSGTSVVGFSVPAAPAL
jgi:peptidoglycan/xylan/chitin deacetylase (PgdA/CDA1 family)